MALKNPQEELEDGIFGKGGMHPTPATLPYPAEPLETIYGVTVEYLTYCSPKAVHFLAKSPVRVESRWPTVKK